MSSAPEVSGQDEQLLRQKLPVSLPTGVPIHYKYSKLQDVLTIMLGQQDRWPPVTRTSGQTTVHVDKDGSIVRLEVAHASTLLPSQWLQRHCRSSGARKRLGLP